MPKDTGSEPGEGMAQPKDCPPPHTHTPPFGLRCTVCLATVQMYGGKDATEAFMAHHIGPQRALAAARMTKYLLGNMAPRELSPHAQSYKKMRLAVESAGLYKHNDSYYYLLYAYLVCCFAATWWLVAGGHIILGACTISMFWGQVRQRRQSATPDSLSHTHTKAGG